LQSIYVPNYGHDKGIASKKPSMCGSSEEKIGAKRKGKLVDRGARLCNDEVEVWRESLAQCVRPVSVSSSQPTKQPASITEHYGLLYACVSILFPTASALDESSRILQVVISAAAFARVIESGAQPLGREASSYSASSIVVHSQFPLGPGTCGRSIRQAYRQTALDCSAAHPLHLTSHLCWCMGF
jgi:hypothetical protein